MALFKISKGLKANLPTTKTAGYCWYTTDDSLFYIDYEDSNGVVQRKALNAKEAEKLAGASLATILNSTDLEIPTSKAVLTALAGKANATHSHDDKYYTESEIDTKLASKSDTNHKHDGVYDTKGSAATVQQNLNAVNDELDAHIGNSNIHVTATNKTNWNTAYAHSQSDHSSDWSVVDETSAAYIKNKPFYDSDGVNITWDGDTTGRDYATTIYSYVFYKVSDDVLMSFDISDDNTSIGFYGGQSNKNISLNYIYEKNGVIFTGDYEIFSVPQDNMEVETNWGTLTFPSAGIYFFYQSNSYYINRLTIQNTPGKIYSKALPQGIASKVELEKHINNRTWKMLYDSGAITKNVNGFGSYVISGYNKIKIAIKCVNVAESAGTTAGSVYFVSQSGGNYCTFSTLFPSLITNTSGVSAAMAEFSIIDGFIVCENALRSTNAPNMFSTAYNKGEWGLTSVGGGMMVCNNVIQQIGVATTNNSDSHFYGAGSRLIIWGCKE